MEIVKYVENNWVKWGLFYTYAVLGALFISICSMIKVPFYPVSFTMHTFSISLIALLQKPKLATASVLTYLLAGTCGLPVFVAKANPNWYAGLCAGYYIAFPISAFLLSTLHRKKCTFLGIALAQVLILGLGSIWLSAFLGWKTAMMSGALFFMVPDTLKNLMAYGLVRQYESSTL